MSDVRRAACSCGQLSVQTRGEPIRVSLCHCLACQRRTGSAFGVQARFAEADVTMDGDSRSYQRRGDAGATATFRFCGTCGATVWYTLDAMPGMIAVPVGAFADPSFPSPRFTVYEARRHGWVDVVGEGIERWD